MIDTIIILIMCHMVGDYVLQTKFIAESKGQNWYHMFVHCVLYCAPFAFMFGITWQLMIIFGTHMIIDPLKAKWGKINYLTDQLLHYLILAIYFL